jgi:hypothetical protein
MDPAEIARRAYERRLHPHLWGVNDDALKQPANASVVSVEATREKVRRVHRYDGFALLRSRDAITDAQEKAVRRLEEYVAIRYRVDQARASDERVDRTSSPGPLVTDASMEAADLIRDIGSATGGHSFSLLLAILEPQVHTGQPVNWRAKVLEVTGERFPHGQVALIRAACENLRQAWAAYDNRPRKAA